ILSEPAVNWQSATSITFENAGGLTVTCASAATAPTRGVMFGTSAFGADGQLRPRSVTQHQLSVTLKSDPQPGRATLPELRGTLAATMQLGTQLTVTVDDVNKPNAKADDAHGTHVRVGNCQVNGDGSVTVQTDVERP